MFKLCFLIVLIKFGFILPSAAFDCQFTPKNAVQRIKKDIFCSGYDNTVYPKGKDANSTDIRVVMILRHILVNDYAESLTLSMYLEMEWLDNMLTWDSKSYDGIVAITEPISNLWIPDLFLQNKEDMHQTHATENCNKSPECHIEVTGLVTCAFACSFDGICKMDIRNWPLDEMACSINMSLWNEPGTDEHFNASGLAVRIGFYEDNTAWRLNKMDHNVTIAHNAYAARNLSTIELYFWVQRYPGKDMVIIVIPSIFFALINLVSLLYTCITRERILLCFLNVILEFSCYSSQQSIPEGGDLIPYFVLFLRSSIILTSVLTITTVIYCQLIQNDCYMPDVIHKITVYWDSSKMRMILYSHALSDAEQAQGKYPGKQQVQWLSFSKLMDFILFAIYAVTYVILISMYIPSEGKTVVPNENIFRSNYIKLN